MIANQSRAALVFVAIHFCVQSVFNMPLSRDALRKLSDLSKMPRSARYLKQDTLLGRQHWCLIQDHGSDSSEAVVTLRVLATSINARHLSRFMCHAKYGAHWCSGLRLSEQRR